MLSLFDVYALYAELSLALAGFAGVVSAFSGRDRAFRPTELLRVLAVILNSAAVLFGSLVFYSLLGASLPEAQAIRGSAFTSLVVTSFVWIFIVPPAWREANTADSTTSVGVLGFVVAILIALSILYGAGALGAYGSGTTLVGFPIQLALALWMFGRLLLRPN